MRTALISAACVLVLVGRAMAAPGDPVGSEFQVNTYTTGPQGYLGSGAASDADGDFVVVWYGAGPGDDYGVLGQRFSSAGAAVGSEFQVATVPPGPDPIFPPFGRSAVASDADGDFVVVWYGAGPGDYSGVVGQRFSSAGAAVGSEFQVNTYTTLSQGYFGPAVASDADGDFVVVWSSQQDGGSGFGTFGIFGQRFSSAGAAVGSEFQVNTYTTGPQGFTSGPAVASDADGDFVVVWLGEGPGVFGGIFGQRFSSAGAAVGSEFQVNTYTTGPQGAFGFYGGAGPAVTVDEAGNFVIVWSGAGPGDDTGVFGQRFDSSGSPLDGQFQVNTYTTHYQGYHGPGVAADADGDFVVVWDSKNVVWDIFGRPVFLGSDGVFGQRFSSAGAAVGSEFQVNTSPAGGPGGAVVATDTAGDFVVVWAGTGPADPSGVVGQRFEGAAAPPTIPTTSFPGSLMLSALLALVMGPALRRRIAVQRETTRRRHRRSGT